MDIGSAAQWVAVIVALTLGIRAEARAMRVHRREREMHEGTAFAKLTEFLARALAALPADNRDDQRWSYETLKELRDASRNAIEPIARAFPNAAGDLLRVAEQLDDLIRLRRASGGMDDHEVLKVLRGLYQDLRLLSITAAMRVRLQGREVSVKTLDEDRYKREFQARYEHVRNQLWKRIGTPRE